MYILMSNMSFDFEKIDINITHTYRHIHIHMYICGFACQQRVLKTFPGPGYLYSEDGLVWL